MSKYIYQNPKECARALQIIAEQVDRNSETYNALDTAINYLGVLQLTCNQEKREREEQEAARKKRHEESARKKQPIGIGDVVKLKADEDDPDALQWTVTRIVEKNYAEGICYDGTCYKRLKLDDLVKTGKNYSEQLAGLLTEMCADMRDDEA